MVRNKTGGNKAKKMARSRYNVKEVSNIKQLAKNSDDLLYGYVSKMLGNAQCTVECSDGKTRRGVIRKQMKRQRKFVKKEDVVLCALRIGMSKDDTVDICDLYTANQVSILDKYGEFDKDFKAVLKSKDEDEVDNIKMKSKREEMAKNLVFEVSDNFVDTSNDAAQKSNFEDILNDFDIDDI